jgi:hypothetical protein
MKKIEVYSGTFPDSDSNKVIKEYADKGFILTGTFDNRTCLWLSFAKVKESDVIQEIKDLKKSIAENIRNLSELP